MPDELVTSLTQWGSLNWDDEFEDLCENSFQEDMQPIAKTPTRIVSQDYTLLPASKPAESSLAAEVYKANTANDFNDPSDGDDEKPERKQVSRIPTPTRIQNPTPASTPTVMPTLSHIPTPVRSSILSPPSEAPTSASIPTPTRTPSTPPLAPEHPGWSDVLSPSLNPYHSTPPEVNCWVHSTPIYMSLNNILDMTEEYPSKAASVLCGLLKTDDYDFSSYRFPRGATGLMRPSFDESIAPRPAEPQRSSMHLTESASYTPEDLNVMEYNIKGQLKQIWQGIQLKGLEITLAMDQEVDKEAIAQGNGVLESNTKDSTVEAAGAQKSCNTEANSQEDRVQEGIGQEFHVQDASTQVKESGPGESIALKTAMEYKKTDEEILAFATASALPGIDFVQEFLDDTDSTSYKGLSIFFELTDHLEAARERMELHLNEIQYDSDEGYETSTSTGEQRAEDKTERKAKSQASVFDTVSSVGALFWECVNERLRVFG